MIPPGIKHDGRVDSQSGAAIVFKSCILYFRNQLREEVLYNIRAQDR